MTQALTRSVHLKLHFTTMTQYDKTFSVPFVLTREHPNNILANVMAQLNWKNLRVAETEKYAHVTYFFNGGNEKPYPGEERELVPSPKVATYDLKPEMNAEGITEAVRERDREAGFRRDRDELRQCRHGGPLRQNWSRPSAPWKPWTPGSGGSTTRLRREGGRWIITADHGNAEMMIDPVTKGPHTYHTTNPVPFIVVDEERRPLRPGGSLQDIAPTILGMMGVSSRKR